MWRRNQRSRRQRTGSCKQVAALCFSFAINLHNVMEFIPLTVSLHKVVDVREGQKTEVFRQPECQSFSLVYQQEGASIIIIIGVKI